jgi:cytochrome P450
LQAATQEGSSQHEVPVTTVSREPRVISVDFPELIGNPYKVFRRLRAEAPVCRLDPLGFWAVSGYDEVVYVLKNPKLFSNSGYSNALPPEFQLDPNKYPRSIVHSDPPYHTRLRRLVLREFNPRVAEQMEPRIQEVCRELVDKVVDKPDFELVRDITVPLPVIVIAEMLGVDPTRRDEFKHWCDELVNSLSFNGMPDPVRLEQITGQLYAYFCDVIEQRRREPRPDIISKLVHVQDEESRLTTLELAGFAVTLLVAGNETTTSLIGNTMAALIENPAEFDEVRKNPTLMPQLIEEVLRYYSPAHAVLRQATEDAEVGGQVIPKDAIVLPLIGSANRDERKFPGGERFDVSRDAKGHIAFGMDLHACLGSALARVESRCILREMFSRMPGLHAKDTSLQWVPSLQMRALQRLEMLPA